MLNYRFARLQNDGSWVVHEFLSGDDDDAVAYRLTHRTANECELYRRDRLVATFDGSQASPMTSVLWQKDRRKACRPNSAEMETEGAYFLRKATEERDCALIGLGSARDAHLGTAEYLESLARAIEAKRRRLCFYDANAGTDTGGRGVKAGTKCGSLNVHGSDEPAAGVDALDDVETEYAGLVRI